MTTRAARKELVARDYYCDLIKYLSGKEYVRMFPRHKHLKIVSEGLDAIREFIQNSVEIQTLADQHRRKDRGNDGAGGGSGGSGDAGVSTGGSGLTAVKAGAN